MLDNIEDEYTKNINKALAKKINELALLIGIIPKEARFILDLEVLFAEGKKSYKIDAKIYDFCKNVRNVVNGKPWLVVRNRHIEALNFNINNWSYIKESHENIVSYFSKIKYLDMFLSSIKNSNMNYNKSFKIPNSIGLLTEIKSLDLSHNNISEIPNSMNHLASLKILNLGYNNIIEISESICFLSSLKFLDLSHNNIQMIPESIKNLNSLIELNLEKNNIKSIPNSLKSFLNSLENFTI